MASECTQFILEESAKHLEGGAWKQGGSSSFCPSLFVSLENGRPVPSKTGRSLCLMDTVARETVGYVIGTVAEPRDLMEAVHAATLNLISDTAFTMRKVIMDHIRENVSEYLVALNRLEQGRDDGSTWQMLLSRLSNWELVWFFNDHLCDGGESAAKILRKVIKEL